MVTALLSKDAELFHVGLSDALQFPIIAAVAEVGEGPFEGTIPAVAVAGNEIGPDIISKVDFLSGIFEARQDNLVVIQIADIQINPAAPTAGDTVFYFITDMLGSGKGVRRDKLMQRQETSVQVAPHFGLVIIGHIERMVGARKIDFTPLSAEFRNGIFQRFRTGPEHGNKKLDWINPPRFCHQFRLYVSI